eukprot:CAMPEP_0113561332 /NCGR_PEP_ID=MMETSP0015_2-20120614/19918_1 /TAXON_ID=2838 /ORGANISM="Odontella" /LENGTH=54 /DNA_ID=CAMNT_0000463117 /DNA_START=188 /DNA_END=349 /DNA_ORIENTATION=+ /assembly_acc=CAM_ASM_000160
MASPAPLPHRRQDSKRRYAADGNRRRMGRFRRPQWLPYTSSGRDGPGGAGGGGG